MHSRFFASPAHIALMAVALAGSGAMAQAVETAAAPPPTATLPEAAPPPPVRTMTETVAPEALAQMRAEQAAKTKVAKPATKPVVRVAASRPAATAPTVAAEPDTIVPATEEPTGVAEAVPLPPPEPRETVTITNDGTNEDWMLYGGVAVLAAAGIGAAIAARRRKARFSEDDRGVVEMPVNRATAPQPAPVLAEPGRTRVIEPVAVPPAPVAAAPAVVAASRDPLFAKQAPMAEGVTDPLFTRKAEPLPPVTDPLFAQKTELPPVTDPMFADRPEYAGPGSKGSRAAAINRMRATGKPQTENRATAKDVEFAF